MTRGGVDRPASAVPRPAGPLLWLHSGDPKLAAATAALAARLREIDDDASLLLTGTTPLPGAESADPPPDTLADARRFLDGWRPDAGVVLGYDVPTTLLVEAARRDLPLVHVAGETPPPQHPGPRALRPLIDRYVRRLATGTAGLAHGQTLGATDVEVIGPLADVPEPPACNEAEREDLAALLSGRPLWLAVGAWPGDVDALIAAQRHAGGYSHRLLHVVRPADPRDGPAFVARYEAAGFRTLLRSDGDDPERDVQVLVVDDAHEDGLWYRLAALTVFGGSFARDAGPVAPWGAAALGSAIVHGPETRPEHAAFDRLARAGATDLVPYPERLGETVARIMSPDVAARLAHAAWQEVSAGTAATDRVVDLALDAMGR